MGFISVLIINLKSTSQNVIMCRNIGRINFQAKKLNIDRVKYREGKVKSY